MVIPLVLVLLPLVIILVAKPLKAKLLVQYPVEYKIAGAWMNEHLPKDACILARKPEIELELKNTLISKAVALGFDTTKLVFPDQKSPPP